MRYILVAIVLVRAACQAFFGGASGAGIGFAATKSAEGTLAGFLAGFIVGGYNDIKNWWLGLWGKLTTEPASKVESTSSGLRHEVIGWVALACLVWFLYKMLLDYEFRGHVLGFFKRGANPMPKRKRPNADQSP